MIVVESPGLQTTVQDLGRPGHAEFGIAAAGAADPVALRCGNLLLGNAANAAALEMTLAGGRFRFQQAASAALTGSAHGKLNGAAVEAWTAFDIPAGALFEAGVDQSGARAYLCLAGGIDVPSFLGSASTHLLTGLGGYAGRALRKGDVLRVGLPDSQEHHTIRREILTRLAPRKTLRLTYAPQTHWFSDEQRAALVTHSYRVTPHADRMGLRLEGCATPCANSAHMITEGVSTGALQIPPGGQPIILFVDQQTTGGYPKIANVIAADLASVGQLRPGDEIRFEWVSFATALALAREQESLLSPAELFAS